MRKNTEFKKYLIYARYLLPIIALAVIFAMLFVPSYRFIFSGKAGERISEVTLIANSWEQSRGVLFATEEQRSPDLVFSRIVFALIIALALIYIFALAVAVWTAVVAIRYFNSDDEEGAERTRRIFTAFFPNRIVLCAINLLGLLIAVFPYCMRPIYAFAYSESVRAVLEGPDALIVGGVLLLLTVILSIALAPEEKRLGADIFKKYSRTVDEEIEELEKEDSAELSDEDADRIRRMFYGSDKKNNDNKTDEKNENN